MSGICGIVNFHHQPIEPELLCKMATAAAYRGPDGIHHWQNGTVGLTHLALNITPESLQEQQPLVHSERSLVLTADARIDNRDELIYILTAKSYLTESAPTTDAQLILAAYQYWGTECPAHLIGDFAFAIWDGQHQQLFAARDAMGMRSLYYRIEPTRFLFGTEVKQILAASNETPAIYEPMLGAWLAGYAGNLEWTFYQNIMQLPPAHALLMGAKKQRVWRYWDIDPDFQLRYAKEEEYAEHFLEIFKEAVRCRLRSVKPAGIFLSGGVDSGSAAATAGWLKKQDPTRDYPHFSAYSYAFETFAQCDERHISNEIAKHYHLPVINIPAETAYPLKDYPQHSPDQDEPLMGAYKALHDLTLAQAKADGIGVMFTGARGDQMMGGGVLDFLGLLLAGHWKILWHELQAYSEWKQVALQHTIKTHLLRPPLASLSHHQGVKQLHQQLKHLTNRHKHSYTPTYPAWVSSEFSCRVKLADIVQQSCIPSPVEGLARQQRYETVFGPMEMRVVTWNERNYAQFGISHEDAWSDRRLASFVLAVPQHLLNRLEEQKRLARQAMVGIIPENARQTMGKIYPSALYEYATRKQCQKTVLNLITRSQSELRGYLKEIELQNHYQKILKGEAEHSNFWCALTVEMWLRQHWS